MSEHLLNEQLHSRQSIIFDMDGTLFQTDRILEISLIDTFNYLKSLNEWKQEAPVQQYRSIMGVPLTKVWETLLPDHSKELRELTNSYFLNRLVNHIREGKGALYPHVENVFTYLKEKNCALFIASNGLVEYLKAIVKYYELDKWVTETFSIE